MRIMLLCNAGLAIECENEILLVDALNVTEQPFAGISDELWERILNRKPPFDRVCGLYFTHLHPDHCDMRKVKQYQSKWPDIPCWLPDETTQHGTLHFGSFAVEYGRVSHAPMDEPLPDHVVTWIAAGERRVYIAADAALEPKSHKVFLYERTADVAFWNSMYLSRPETRELLSRTSARNYIYHMPETNPDGYGIWKKCNNNLQRYADEMKSVRVLKHYPTVIEL